MSTPELPLSTVTAILGRAFGIGQPKTIMRQVRHWTVTGLLQPAKKSPGTGRSRQYPIYQVHKAAVLVELARYGMTVGLSESVAEWFDHLHELRHPLLELAASGRCRVYLKVMGLTQDIDFLGSIFVHDDDMKIAEAAQPESARLLFHPVSKALLQGSLAQPAFGQYGVFSALWIDLTQLLTKVEGAYEQLSASQRTHT